MVSLVSYSILSEMLEPRMVGILLSQKFAKVDLKQVMSGVLVQVFELTNLEILCSSTLPHFNPWLKHVDSALTSFCVAVPAFLFVE